MQSGLAKRVLEGVREVKVLGDALVVDSRGIAKKWGAPGPHWLSPEGVTYDGFEVQP